MRMFPAAALAAALALSGCVDVELEATALVPDQVRVNGAMTIAREMMDMMGGPTEFCDPAEGSTLVLTETQARCEMLVEGTTAEVFTQQGDDPAPSMTDLGDGTVRIAFPLGDMTADTAEIRNDPQARAMFLPMMTGHQVELRIRGAEIVSTNGTISQDGTIASYAFQLEQLLDADFQALEVFEAVVRY